MIMAEKTTWRPQSTIRLKVIGIAFSENRILVCEVLNDERTLKGWCPLGGGVNFGETSEEALRREFMEELGCQLTILDKPIFCENIFEHQGVKGHEIVLIFPVILNDSNLYKKVRFQIKEDSGSLHWVEWVELDRFKHNKDVLFPSSLLSHLDELQKIF
jgi:8-oxo-dGTP pyrophosphatase MutT (NUDIX family)